ncbi:hypothetical protein AVS7_02270 [Acidovorax sp. MR-S7]|nr:hypothetical protein AVS7_02270 [Acidovorax sp. MR-S7]
MKRMIAISHQIPRVIAIFFIIFLLYGSSAHIVQPCLTFRANPFAPERELYVIAGQSNAVGLASIEGEKNKSISYPNVKIYGVYGYHTELHGMDDALQSKSHHTYWPSHAAWHTAQPGFGYKNAEPPSVVNYFGPELKIAELLSNQTPHDHYIVKLAVAGTGLAYTPAEDNWNPSSGRLFNQLMTMISDAYNSRKNSAKLRVSGLLLVQGETDSLNWESAKNYETNMNRFINAFRDQVYARGCSNSRDIPVVLAKIQNNPVWIYREQVRLAQERLSRDLALVKLVETDDFTTEKDGVHFNMHGQMHLGEKAYSHLALSKISQRKSHLKHETQL